MIGENTIIVRKATLADLPVIEILITESFAAIGDHYGDEVAKAGQGDEMLKTIMAEELNANCFEKVHFSNPGDNFWVAECSSNGVVGCIAVKQKSSEEYELHRMAVRKHLRGGGVGAHLVNMLKIFCKKRKALRVVLTTAHPLAAKFYSKNDFVTFNEFSFEIAEGCKLSVYTMCYYLGEKLIRNVAVVGGVHGNERLGATLINQWKNAPEVTKRPTFTTQLIVGNPIAVELNCRYNVADLNRMFDLDNLNRIGVTGAVNTDEQAAVNLNQALGPKTKYYQREDSCDGVDFVIDLHSSNSNVGLMLMTTELKLDSTSAKLACHLQNKFTDLVVTTTSQPKANCTSVDSIAPSGVAIEVGPVQHGTMSHTLLEATRCIVFEILDYLERRNNALIEEALATITKLAAANQAIDNYGDSGFDPLNATVISRELAPSVVTPSTFPRLEYYTTVGKILYPSRASPTAFSVAGGDDNTKQTEGSIAANLDSKQHQIKKACFSDYILHPTVEDTNWKPLIDGTPLFISAHGDNEVVNFDRTIHVTSTGAKNIAPKSTTSDKKLEPLYPAFINESAYQGNNIAMVLTKMDSSVVY